MQLKYFMRGVGTGVLFTLFVFLVIIIPNVDLKDRLSNEDEISVSASSQTDVSGLLGTGQKNNKDDSSTPSADVTGTATIDAPVTDVPAGDVTKAPADDKAAEDKNDASAQTTPAQQEPDVSEPAETEVSTPAQQEPVVVPTVVEQKIKAVIKISDGMTSEMFCKELETSGIVDSWRDINSYIIEKGFDRKIRNGTYTFTEGMTYEEICTVVTTKQQT